MQDSSKFTFYPVKTTLKHLNPVGSQKKACLNLSRSLVVLDEIVLVQHCQGTVDLGTKFKSKERRNTVTTAAQFQHIHKHISSVNRIASKVFCQLGSVWAVAPSPHVVAPKDDPLQLHLERCHRAFQIFKPKLAS